MQGIGDRMVEKLKAVERRGGWKAAGFDFGPNNRLHVLLGAGLVYFDDARRDYVVTATGYRLATANPRRAHRRVETLSAV